LGGIDGFEGRSAEKIWLIAILKNKVTDHFRKMGRELMNISQDQEKKLDPFFHENGNWKDKPERWDTSPDLVLKRKEFWNIFLSCLSELSDRLRIAFSLREMEGLGCEEICKVLGVSSSNCWVMLYRARMLLRRCLGVNWFGGKDVRPARRAPLGLPSGLPAGGLKEALADLLNRPHQRANHYADSVDG
jgi:RNA polymerase sigma-70 factor (ECF subfamily)